MASKNNYPDICADQHRTDYMLKEIYEKFYKAVETIESFKISEEINGHNSKEILVFEKNFWGSKKQVGFLKIEEIDDIDVPAPELRYEEFLPMYSDTYIGIEYFINPKVKSLGVQFPSDNINKVILNYGLIAAFLKSTSDSYLQISVENAPDASAYFSQGASSLNLFSSGLRAASNVLGALCFLENITGKVIPRNSQVVNS